VALLTLTSGRGGRWSHERFDYLDMERQAACRRPEAPPRRCCGHRRCRIRTSGRCSPH
jgi:hypothetical protein